MTHSQDSFIHGQRLHYQFDVNICSSTFPAKEYEYETSDDGEYLNFFTNTASSTSSSLPLPRSRSIILNHNHCPNNHSPIKSPLLFLECSSTVPKICRTPKKTKHRAAATRAPRRTRHKTAQESPTVLLMTISNRGALQQHLVALARAEAIAN